MKKGLIFIFTLLISFNALAQRGDKMKDQIKARKIAYITEKLNLTSDEAEKFWPIFNTFESENQELKREGHSKHRGLDFDSLNETEAKKILEKVASIENKRHSLKVNYLNDLLKVLPAKKIVLLRKAEEDFNKRMFQELRKRREKMKSKKERP